MAGASAQWRRNQDGSAYGYYSVLTAWIMAGASAPYCPDGGRVWYGNTKYRLLTIIFCLLVLVRKLLVSVIYINR